MDDGYMPKHPKTFADSEKIHALDVRRNPRERKLE